jgi:hypothetical protein
MSWLQPCNHSHPQAQPPPPQALCRAACMSAAAADTRRCILPDRAATTARHSLIPACCHGSAPATPGALLLGPGLAPPGSQLSKAKALLRVQVLLSCCAQGASGSARSTRPPTPVVASLAAAVAVPAAAAGAGCGSYPRAAATWAPQAVQRALLLSSRLTELVLLRRSWAAAWTVKERRAKEEQQAAGGRQGQDKMEVGLRAAHPCNKTGQLKHFYVLKHVG